MFLQAFEFGEIQYLSKKNKSVALFFLLLALSFQSFGQNPVTNIVASNNIFNIFINAPFKLKLKF